MAKTRSRKERSAIVAAAGMMSEVWTKLRETVKDRGGEDADIYVLNTPNGKPILAKLADMIVAKATKPIIQVAWSRVLPWIIKVCLFGCYVNPDITAEHFPLQLDDLKIKEIKIVKPGRCMSTTEVLKFLDDQGLRPATLLELLFWWLTNPDARGGCLVVALGQIWNSLVPCVDGDVGYRELRLFSVSGIWFETSLFAAASKWEQITDAV